MISTSDLKKGVLIEYQGGPCMVESVKVSSPTEGEAENWIEHNRKYSEDWPNITRKHDSPADAEEWNGKPDKMQYFSPKPGQG